jgi:hypothetical protein
MGVRVSRYATRLLMPHARGRALLAFPTPVNKIRELATSRLLVRAGQSARRRIDELSEAGPRQRKAVELSIFCAGLQSGSLVTARLFAGTYGSIFRIEKYVRQETS